MHSPADEFHAFFEQHHAELARLAFLLLRDAEEADDLTADAFAALWHRWDRVRGADRPVAYARGVVANLARTRIRSLTRERRHIALFWSRHGEPADGPDVPAVLDVRDALVRLPFRRRACVVLRHALDVSERDTARTLGISTGTVKSQASRGIAELAKLLNPAPPAGPAPGRPGAGTPAVRGARGERAARGDRVSRPCTPTGLR